MTQKPKPASALGPPPPNPYANRPQEPPPPTEDQVKLTNEVQRARDALYEAIAQYRGLLNEYVLPQNRTKAQNDERTKIFQNLNIAHGDLEQLNVGEAPLALTFTALHGLLTLRDEINELKFQNTMLYKKLKEQKQDATQ